MDINKIITNSLNPNYLEPADYKRLKELIQREGNYPPLIVNKRDGKYYLIDGHQRLMVLKELGYTDVKVDIWEVDEATEHLLLATLNRLHGKSRTIKKRELYKLLKKEVPTELLARICPENRKFINDIILEQRQGKKEKIDFIKKIQFIQLLTREEYKYVTDYINKRFKKKEDKEKAIYLIIKEINGTEQIKNNK